MSGMLAALSHLEIDWRDTPAFPGTKTSLEEIAEGDAIPPCPTTPTNMTRAFLLLADAGLISVPEGTTLESTVTPDDITGDLNPNGLEF